MHQEHARPFHLLFLVLFFALIPYGPSQAKDFDDGKAMHVGYPSWFNQNPFFDLKEELDKARTAGKQGLMVLFTTQGCSYCDRFIEKSLGDSRIASDVQANFASIGLEIFDDSEMTDPRGKRLAVKHFAKSEGAGFSPTLVFYNADGDRVLRVVGYQSPERFTEIVGYVTGKHYRTESLADYFSGNSVKSSKQDSNYALKDDPIFGNPPYMLDRSRFPASQPLLVIFEKPGCAECAEFHSAVLSLKEVRDTLKAFDVVRFDATDDHTPVLAPTGDRVTPASWFKQTSFTRVPALLFFDQKGNQVLDTDALVLRIRMLNSLHYVLERAYEKGWTYQRFARSRAIERNLRNRQEKQ